MSRSTPSIERAALYEAVWETPVIHLAKRLGVSGAEIKRACETMGIPMPIQGHWSRIRHGHDVERLALPALQEGSPDSYTFRLAVEVVSPESKPRQRSIGDVSGLPETFQPPPRVVVPSTLRSAHPMVARTREYWKTPARYGEASSVGGALLDIQVSRSLRSRALRIMQALLETSEAVGFGLEPGTDRFAVLLVEGEKIPFRLRERNRQEMVPSGIGDWKRQVYHPTGDLILELVKPIGHTRHVWRDAKTQRVEDLIVSFLVGAYREAEAQKEWEARRMEWKRQEELKRQAAIDRAREAERLEALEAQASRWRASQDVLALVDAAEDRASQIGMTDEERLAFARWVLWAREHARSMDPLEGGLSFLTSRDPRPKSGRRRIT